MKWNFQTALKQQCSTTRSWVSKKWFSRQSLETGWTGQTRSPSAARLSATVARVIVCFSSKPMKKISKLTWLRHSLRLIASSKCHWVTSPAPAAQATSKSPLPPLPAPTSTTTRPTSSTGSRSAKQLALRKRRHRFLLNSLKQSKPFQKLKIDLFLKGSLQNLISIFHWLESSTLN